MTPRSMLTTLAPRPWMPHVRHRSALACTTVPRSATPPRYEGARRRLSVPESGPLARLRALIRRPPALTFRLDELTAETEAWIADLSEEARLHR